MSILPIEYDLLERYNRPGPRYTSYPPVPNWQNSFGQQHFYQALDQLAQDTHEPISLYVHLPFCAERCYYCGCNATVTRHSHVVDRYLDCLEREIALVSARLGARRQAIQLHWGGGTPNFLSNEQMSRLFEVIAQHFELLPEAEISVEVDPRIGTARQMLHLRRLGFNRISLGVQDIDPQVQRAIGRIQPREQTELLYWACKEYGFGSVNLDLIYGLPFQTRQTFARTLECVLSLAPDRVACYSYAHLPRSRPNQKLVDISVMPSTEEKFGLFCQAIDAFEAEGYNWIGMDHFARKNDELSKAMREKRLHRNFMGYTVQPSQHLLAFGCSAISEFAGCYSQNDAKLGNYQRAIEAGELPIVRGHQLSVDDQARQKAITHLMCNMELPYTIVNERMQADLERIRSYQAEGFIEAEPDRLTVTAKGRFFIRPICMELDAYLPALRDKPLFSSTI